MKLQIKTLSPIHIGNGEKYNGLSYIFGQNKIFIYNSDHVMKNITPQYSQGFMLWIEQRIAEIEQLESQRRNEQRPNDIKKLLREAQKKLSLKEFIENELKDIAIKNNFNRNISYSIETKTQVYNNIDIDCFIKQNNKPYIPGTEIKGAIRTAVLYRLLNNGKKLDNLFKEIKEFGNKHSADISKVRDKRLERGMRDEKRIKEKILVKEMKDIFKNTEESLLRTISNFDAKYDLLKMLYIGDTESKVPAQCLFISDISVIGTRPLRTFQEFCKSGQIFTCQGFKLDNNHTILDKLGFSPEQRGIVEDKDAKNLFQCCYEFSNKLLEEELAYSQYPESVKNRLKAIKQQNKPESPVIRIGKNEGYLSLTMGLLVKEKDKSLYDNVLCHATKNTSYSGCFPKTRRIVNLGNGEADTCGWVKLTCINAS